ncbi:MAG: hypothetical protein AAGF10_07500, partial [Verrucomicrobiota bacterium]
NFSLTISLTYFFNEVLHFHASVAYAITLLIVFVWNFVIVRFWVFKDSQSQRSTANFFAYAVIITFAARVCEWSVFMLVSNLIEINYLLLITAITGTSLILKFLFLSLLLKDPDKKHPAGH